MACSGAPILRGGREGGSWLPGPVRTGASHLNRCLGNLPPSHVRDKISALAGPRIKPFFHQCVPQALFTTAWVPELVGPNASKVEDRSQNPKWHVKTHGGKLLRRRVPQMRRTEAFPLKRRPFSRLAKSLQKWCCWPKEQFEDDRTPPPLKFISLFDRLDPEREMILGGGKFLNACLLFYSISSRSKGIF